MLKREQKLCVGKTPLPQIRNCNEMCVDQILSSLFAELDLKIYSIDSQVVFHCRRAKSRSLSSDLCRWPMRTSSASRCVRPLHRGRLALTTDS